MIKINGVILYDRHQNDHVVGALKFFAESLVLTLQDLGHTTAQFRHQSYLPEVGTWIVLGAHTHAEAFTAYNGAAKFIIFNTEHPGSGWWNVAAYQTLRTTAFQWWDYCGECNGPATVVPQSHPEQYVRVRRNPSTSTFDTKDIDVFFAGSQCPRRQWIFNELINRGLVVVHVFNVYGEQLDELIDRSRVCINVHYYDNPPVFESVRVSHLLSRGAKVISEDDPSGIAAVYPGVFAAVPYGELVQRVTTEIAVPQARSYVRPGTMHVDLYNAIEGLSE